MAGTMTWAAMDLHARSTYAASLDVITGELSRRRFDTGAAEPVVEWLVGLPGPVRACYEVGPTGFVGTDADRGAVADIGGGSGPRPGAGASTDRSDALPASALKLLLRHGRVYDATAWTRTHARWLGRQRFEHHDTELAFIDNLAACDGLAARKQELDERLSGIALEPEFWPLVRRLLLRVRSRLIPGTCCAAYTSSIAARLAMVSWQHGSNGVKSSTYVLSPSGDVAEGVLVLAMRLALAIGGNAATGAKAATGNLRYMSAYLRRLADNSRRTLSGLMTPSLSHEKCRKQSAPTSSPISSSRASF